MFMEKPKKAKIRFTKENLKQNYGDGSNCPIFHALQDAGVPVSHVYSYAWIDNDGRLHEFSTSLQRISNKLANTNSLNRRRELVGKAVIVQL